MDKLLNEPLFYIFFIYGTSFLVMAYVVFRGVKNATSIALVNTYYALALFGLTHGLTELIDWLRFIVKTSGSAEIVALKYASQCLLIVSFVVLFQFAINLLTYRSEKARPLRLAPAALFIVYLLALATMKVTDVAQAGLIARYTFGFAGALLSGIAMFGLAKSLSDVLESQVVQGLVLTGASFCLYALVGGLVIKPVFGLPIQLFRAACAFTIAVSSFSILGIFRAAHPEDKPLTVVSATAQG